MNVYRVYRYTDYLFLQMFNYLKRQYCDVCVFSSAVEGMGDSTTLVKSWVRFANLNIKLRILRTMQLLRDQQVQNCPQ